MIKTTAKKFSQNLNCLHALKIHEKQPLNDGGHNIRVYFLRKLAIHLHIRCWYFQGSLFVEDPLSKPHGPVSLRGATSVGVPVPVPGEESK